MRVERGDAVVLSKREGTPSEVGEEGGAEDGDGSGLSEEGAPARDGCDSSGQQTSELSEH